MDMFSVVVCILTTLWSCYASSRCLGGQRKLKWLDWLPYYLILWLSRIYYSYGSFLSIFWPIIFETVVKLLLLMSIHTKFLEMHAPHTHTVTSSWFNGQNVRSAVGYIISTWICNEIIYDLFSIFNLTAQKLITIPKRFTEGEPTTHTGWKLKTAKLYRFASLCVLLLGLLLLLLLDLFHSFHFHFVVCLVCVFPISSCAC